jgi:hypothetical protein
MSKAADRRHADTNMRTADAASIHNDSAPAQAAAEDRVKEYGSAVAHTSSGFQQHCAELFAQEAVVDIDQAAECLLAKALTLRGLDAKLCSSVARSVQTAPVEQCAVETGTSAADTTHTVPCRQPN